jgi:hypothetical protein
MLRIVCRLLCAVLVASPAAAVTLTAGVDTYIQEATPNTSYEGGVSAVWDGNAGSGGASQALVYFPIFQTEGGTLDAAAVAASTNLRATLQFDVVDQGDGGNFYRLNLPGPIDGSETWNSVGGSGVVPGVNAAASADLSTPDMGTGTFTYDVTSSLQAWAASPGSNAGWGVLPTGNNSLAISTFESGNGPQLTVVEVTDTYIPMGSSWSYYDLILPGDPNYPVDGSTLWYEPGFDDSGWGSGPGQLGYGDGDESTTLSSGNITYLFRTTFLAAALPEQLELELLRDDSAIVYLNGVEVVRDNLPGTVDATTPASAAGIDNASSIFSIDPLLLNANGLNTLAIELHDASTGNADISFDVGLLGLGDAALLAVPEPGTGLLVILGLVALALGRRRS